MKHLPAHHPTLRRYPGNWGKLTSGLLPVEFISLNRSFPDGALPLVANPESIRDDAAQVTGAPEMAEAGDDDSEAA